MQVYQDIDWDLLVEYSPVYIAPTIHGTEYYIGEDINFR